MQIQKQHLDFVSEIYGFALQNSNGSSAWRGLLDDFAPHLNAMGAAVEVIDPTRGF